MNLLDSLLDAIVRLEGDALVMHVGEKPYVVTTAEASSQFRGPLSWGHVELSSRVLTLQAVTGMLAQILPLDHRTALDEYGAVEYDVTSNVDATERFKIVAARGGDDIWLEVRRHPKTAASAAALDHSDVAPSGAAEAESPADVATQAPPVAPPEPAVPVAQSEPAEPVIDQAVSPQAISPDSTPAETPAPTAAVHEEVTVPDEEIVPEPVLLSAHEDGDWSDEVMTEGELGELLRASAAAVITGESEAGMESSRFDSDGIGHLEIIETSEDEDEEEDHDAEISLNHMLAGARPASIEQLAPPPAVLDASGMTDREALLAEQEELWAAHAEASAQIEQPVVPAGQTAGARETRESGDFTTAAAHEPAQVSETVPATQESVPLAQAVAPASAPVSELASADVPVRSESAGEPARIEGNEPAEVAPVQMADDTEKGNSEEAPVRMRPAVILPLSRHGRTDAPVDSRGSGTLERALQVAATRGAASVYVVANSVPMVRVDGEFSPIDGEPAFSAAAVERLTAEIMPHAPDGAASATGEWTIDVQDIGRVRCMSFRDHRGAGLIFRLIPARAISADQLALSAEVQALCSEADGLVLVAGGRGSGKSTLLTSFVDLINRTRSDHVITAETRIDFLHENKRSFISQREIPGDADAMTAAVRAACREDPDVLIVDDLGTPELITLAIEAAQTGRLVFAAIPAPSALAAVDRLIEMFPPERREKLQALLAGTLRGIVSQVLLRRLRGGRVAAREVLLNTPAVAKLIVEGKTFQLPAAVESGRRFGMMSLAESLATLVREGVVHPSHAYRKAPNREQFLAILRRDGVDTSTAERLA